MSYSSDKQLWGIKLARFAPGIYVLSSYILDVSLMLLH